MKDLFQFLLMAAPEGAEGGAAGAAGLMSFLPFVLIIAIFYFLIIRPQNKKQKETQKMLEALKKGDKVVTIGGVHGVISSVDGTEVVLKVDDNTKIKFSRSAISSVSARDGEKSDKIEDKKDDSAKPAEQEQKTEPAS